MLDEVRDTGLGDRLVPGAGADPEAERGRADALDVLGDDPLPAGEGCGAVGAPCADGSRDARSRVARSRGQADVQSSSWSSPRVSPTRRGTARIAQESAGDVRGRALARVVADRQPFAVRGEDDLGRDDEAREAK